MGLAHFIIFGPHVNLPPRIGYASVFNPGTWLQMISIHLFWAMYEHLSRHCTLLQVAWTERYIFWVSLCEWRFVWWGVWNFYLCTNYERTNVCVKMGLSTKNLHKSDCWKISASSDSEKMFLIISKQNWVSLNVENSIILYFW